MTQMLKTLVGEVFFYVAIFGFSDLIVNYFHLKFLSCVVYYSLILFISILLLKNDILDE